MRYISTRGGISPVSFTDAVMMGMARDGGLLLPDDIPDVRDNLDRWSRLSYTELALEILHLFCDFAPETLRSIIKKSYASFTHPDITPVVRVGGLHVLELFHGPTLAFKDVALQFLGHAFEHILGQRGESLNILAATSGDTGSAAIHGVRGRPGIRIFVMHPHGRISPNQERQMTSVLDDNVFNLAVEGTFDDCQRIMKDLFADLAFKDRHCLGTVNSINWARLISQSVYYFYSAFRVMAQTGAGHVRFAVPTGNFGDVFAGYLAARMGLPISRLVVATNENDVLARFFATGEYRPAPVKPTISPSMDIQVASNFERYIYYRLGADAARTSAAMAEFAEHKFLRLPPRGAGQGDDLFAGVVGGTDGVLETIRDTYARHGYLMDPHTAVGALAASAHQSPDAPMICLATAHPAKFSEAILRAVGSDVARHPMIDALQSLPTRCEVVPASTRCIREYIANHVEGATAQKAK
jgi:threonine synthase